MIRILESAEAQDGGHHADYLVKQLSVFQRTDERTDGAIMRTVAHELTPQGRRTHNVRAHEVRPLHAHFHLCNDKLDC